MPLYNLLDPEDIRFHAHINDTSGQTEIPVMNEQNTEPYQDHCEMGIDYPMTKTIPGCPDHVGQDHTVVYKLEANNVRRTVVKRDDDVLSAEQLKAEWPKVQEAMMKELKTWAKLDCLS